MLEVFDLQTQIKRDVWLRTADEQDLPALTMILDNGLYHQRSLCRIYLVDCHNSIHAIHSEDLLIFEESVNDLYIGSHNCIKLDYDFSRMDKVVISNTNLLVFNYKHDVQHENGRLYFVQLIFQNQKSQNMNMFEDRNSRNSIIEKENGHSSHKSLNTNKSGYFKSSNPHGRMSNSSIGYENVSSQTPYPNNRKKRMKTLNGLSISEMKYKPAVPGAVDGNCLFVVTVEQYLYAIDLNRDLDDINKYQLKVTLHNNLTNLQCGLKNNLFYSSQSTLYKITYGEGRVKNNGNQLGNHTNSTEVFKGTNSNSNYNKQNYNNQNQSNSDEAKMGHVGLSDANEINYYVSGDLHLICIQYVDQNLIYCYNTQNKTTTTGKVEGGMEVNGLLVQCNFFKVSQQATETTYNMLAIDEDFQLVCVEQSVVINLEAENQEPEDISNNYDNKENTDSNGSLNNNNNIYLVNTNVNKNINKKIINIDGAQCLNPQNLKTINKDDHTNKNNYENNNENKNYNKYKNENKIIYNYNKCLNYSKKIADENQCLLCFNLQLYTLYNPVSMQLEVIQFVSKNRRIVIPLGDFGFSSSAVSAMQGQLQFDHCKELLLVWDTHTILVRNIITADFYTLQVNHLAAALSDLFLVYNGEGGDAIWVNNVFLGIGLYSIMHPYVSNCFFMKLLDNLLFYCYYTEVGAYCDVFQLNSSHYRTIKQNLYLGLGKTTQIDYIFVNYQESKSLKEKEKEKDKDHSRDKINISLFGGDKLIIHSLLKDNNIGNANNSYTISSQMHLYTLKPNHKVVGVLDKNDQKEVAYAKSLAHADKLDCSIIRGTIYYDVVEVAWNQIVRTNLLNSWDANSQSSFYEFIATLHKAVFENDFQRDLLVLRKMAAYLHSSDVKLAVELTSLFKTEEGWLLAYKTFERLNLSDYNYKLDNKKATLSLLSKDDGLKMYMMDEVYEKENEKENEKEQKADNGGSLNRNNKIIKERESQNQKLNQNGVNIDSTRDFKKLKEDLKNKKRDA